MKREARGLSFNRKNNEIFSHENFLFPVIDFDFLFLPIRQKGDEGLGSETFQGSL